MSNTFPKSQTSPITTRPSRRRSKRGPASGGRKSAGGFNRATATSIGIGVASHCMAIRKGGEFHSPPFLHATLNADRYGITLQRLKPGRTGDLQPTGGLTSAARRVV